MRFTFPYYVWRNFQESRLRKSHMPISKEQFLEMQQRVDRNRKNCPQCASKDAVNREFDLHNKIMEFCRLQWPRWKYIRARSDRASTIEVGAHDFTIFMPNGKTLCIEVKKKDGKLTEEQQRWVKEMEMLGHKVHVVRSENEFIQLIYGNKPAAGS